MPSYGQFCPIAQAAEVLTERWTLLVVRELLGGSTRFNEIQRGVPLMSSSLLTKRLAELERAGVIDRRKVEGERGHSYELTEAGRALGPLVLSIGLWSREWLKREVTAENSDPALLMWDMQRNIRRERLPKERLVVFFRFRDAVDPKRSWWLVAERESADLCLTDPGFGVDLEIDADCQSMAKVWIGQLELGAAMRSGGVRVRGPEALVRSVPEWLGLSVFAHPDPIAEIERRLSESASASDGRESLSASR